MSQANYYKCDGCDKAIGNKPHITLQPLGGAMTGVALPPGHAKGRVSGWHTAQVISGRLYNFHNGTCAGKLFDKLLAEAKA